MSAIDALLLANGFTWVALIGVQWWSYREGRRDGYSAGYDDRDDEIIHGEPYGTRRKP